MYQNYLPILFSLDLLFAFLFQVDYEACGFGLAGRHVCSPLWQRELQQKGKGKGGITFGVGVARIGKFLTCATRPGDGHEMRKEGKGLKTTFGANCCIQ